MTTPSIPNNLPDEVRNALAVDLTIDITTTGRSSGEPRRIEIWFLNIEGELFIAGTPGPRDWMANLLAEPRFVFHLKESVSADLSATAEPVTERAERERVLSAAAASWYRGQTSVHHLVESAPLVRVTILGEESDG